MMNQAGILHLLLFSFALLFLSIHAQSPLEAVNRSNEEKKAEKFLVEAEEVLRVAAEKLSKVSWTYSTNITEHNEKLKIEEEKRDAAVLLKYGKMAREFNLDLMSDPYIKRKLKHLSNIGMAALEPNDFEQYTQISSKMNTIYSTAKVKSYKDSNKLLSLEPDLKEIFSNSRDPQELAYYWKEWRAASGGKMRELYKEYVKFVNMAAKLNGFKDGTAMKVNNFESEGFEREIELVWEGLKPLYEQIHAYVRFKLHQKYGSDVIDLEGPIPAHLLGNMWAQSWSNINEITRPYPESSDIDITQELVKQGWNHTRIFKSAEKFFISIGLDPMPKDFWIKSMLVRPKDGREVVCHASAWDFYNGEDFRIKQCTSITQSDFSTVHHEMGHVEYYLQYRNQSFLFRNGANNGFHEGVADILSLAVGTADYYKSLGLMDKNVDEKDPKTNINILFNMATEKLVFMPFGYLVDKYRWDLYSNVVDPEKDLNCHWNKLRLEIQGVSPPVTRYEYEGYFDAGAKFHIAGNYGYIRYFTAFIYQFQFFKTMCLASKRYVPGDPNMPLHRCNYYGSEEAGDKLKEMLSLGSSIHWRKAMQIMTGSEEMDTSAFREYFYPLEEWLEQENRKNNVTVGWRVKGNNSTCIPGPPGPQISGSSKPSLSSLLLFIMGILFICQLYLTCPS
ncbi:angiotensin-converting enzyme [Lepeophtheirus salmonis]|uniref:angiotensin-converting enzyme n=1 Tax=Lepeophtheirus salmonis TaxID=72036 RepID=UPI001AE99106|nr:angiotensin-converting enzyme-like [Lepeophtheirus salmonis]XP_040570336.1 angiotensin-converting enzyme-like [Lepeophtheirus salmonis]